MKQLFAFVAVSLICPNFVVANDWFIDMSDIRIADFASEAAAWNAVKVRVQSLTDDSSNLAYSSTQTPDPQTFTVYFIPTSADTRLAVLSDDGVNVSITDTVTDTTTSNVVNRLQVGQALPDVNNSLQPVPFEWVANRLYRLTVQYDNIIYNAVGGDIDGIVFVVWNSEADGFDLVTIFENPE